jgi:hypothetical protein
MAKINVTQGTAGAYGAGELQLENKVQMTATLTPVTDNLNTASPLKLSTNLVQTTSTLKITTADNPYIDAEDNSGNNRFTVGRDPASQQVNVDFASNPSGSTTAVGAIRTYRDGVNLSEAMTFIEDGNVGIGTTAPVGILHIKKTAAATRFAIDGDAGQNRLISYRTGAVQRFGLYVNNTAESGANAGSNFAIRAYNDAGTLLSTPLFIERSTSNVGIGTTTPADKLDVEATASGAVGGVISVGNLAASAANNESSLGFRSSFAFSGPYYSARISSVLNSATVSDSALTFKLYDGVIPGGAEVTRITSNGYLRMAASTGGIQFNGDTAAANALDDYEEGTWTMGIAFGNGTTGITYNFGGATYTKIGRQVTVNGYVVLSSKGSSTGAATITGLPFTVGSATGNYTAVTLRLSAVTFTGQFQGNTDISSTTISFNQISALGTIANLEDTNFANNSAIMVNCTYFV